MNGRANLENIVKTVNQTVTVAPKRRIVYISQFGAIQRGLIMVTEVYTVEEVATLLRTTIRTVRSMISAGKIKAVKVGKEYRISKEEYDQFLRCGNDTRES